jgi:hypothetical protein
MPSGVRPQGVQAVALEPLEWRAGVLFDDVQERPAVPKHWKGLRGKLAKADDADEVLGERLTEGVEGAGDALAVFESGRKLRAAWRRQCSPRFVVELKGIIGFSRR